MKYTPKVKRIQGMILLLCGLELIKPKTLLVRFETEVVLLNNVNGEINRYMKVKDYSG